MEEYGIRETEKYLDEQRKLQEEARNSKIFNGQDLSIGALASTFDMTTKAYEEAAKFDQMANDKYDMYRIARVNDSRRREPLNEAIDDRNNRIQQAMQNGSYVDERDKNDFINTNGKQYDQARLQQSVIDKNVREDAKITEINKEKEVKLQQAELDIIDQLGKDRYGLERKHTKEELEALREQAKLIQEMRATVDTSSKIEAPHVMSTEELMENQKKLDALNNTLENEYDELKTGFSKAS